MTVYRRPDPIPLHRSRPAADFALHAVRSEPEGLHQLVSRQIFAAIASGYYPEGSILPNEQALSEELGVSRTALREAVKALAAKGLLETRRRRGTLVLSRSRWNLLDAEIIGWLRKDDARAVSEQLWDAVAAVLPGLASTAASRRSALPRLASDGVNGRARLLVELAHAAGNRFLFSLVSVSLFNLLESDSGFLDGRTAWLDSAGAADLSEMIAQGRGRSAAQWLQSRLFAAETAPAGA